MSLYTASADKFFKCAAPDIEEAFHLYDTVGDGKISVSQIGDVLRAVGQNPTEVALRKCAADHKADDRISFDEFMPILNAISKHKIDASEGDFVEVLRNFDKEGNGFILAVEMRRILTSIGDRLTEEEAEQILEGLEDSQGNINYEEFVRLVMAG